MVESRRLDSPNDLLKQREESKDVNIPKASLNLTKNMKRLGHKKLPQSSFQAFHKFSSDSAASKALNTNNNQPHNLNSQTQDAHFFDDVPDLPDKTSHL